LTEVRQRLDEGDDEQRHEDGHHEHLELREQEEEQVDPGGDHHHPPRPRRRGAQSEGHEIAVASASRLRHAYVLRCRWSGEFGAGSARRIIPPRNPPDRTVGRRPFG
jgi:hypothetical protein